MFKNLWLNAGKIPRKNFFLTKMNPFTVFFKDFDHKLQYLFLNKSQELFLSKGLSGDASVTLSIFNILGINILEQYFYTQQ